MYIFNDSFAVGMETVEADSIQVNTKVTKLFKLSEDILMLFLLDDLTILDDRFRIIDELERI